MFLNQYKIEPHCSQHTDTAGCVFPLNESGTYVICIPVAEPYVLLFIHQKCLNFTQNILEEKEKCITNKLSKYLFNAEVLIFNAEVCIFNAEVLIFNAEVRIFNAEVRIVGIFNAEVRIFNAEVLIRI